jgi:putative tryptophan/tyrosine transport system substrate-binding protein
LDRRHAIVAISCLAAASGLPSAAYAQQKAKVWRVGFLATAGPAASANLLSVFRDSMRKLGYIEGQNLSIDYRWPKTTFEEDPGVVTALVQSNVDVIFAWPTPAALAAKRATSTIPIVFVGLADPVGTGVVSSLAHPGGNVTGISNLARDLAAKQIQLLLQLFPSTQRVGIIANTANPAVKLQIEETERAIRAVGLQYRTAHARSSEDFENAFKRLAADRVRAVVVSPDSTVLEHRKAIAQLALSARLPTFFQREENVEAGGLISYGTSLSDQVRQAAHYIDRVFKGAKPADLPVEQPERIKLVINVKTARALGIQVPSELLLRADEVIQ